ncbi:PspC domain-containing protein [Micromonospora narathiwatensis]|uniref:Phage shock protein C (PspC) family protein n=1 Tax=Micromonospora narathiwatensis TaxID=299146 RepID=A0A1A9A472_9ACTN|nr:PspC domain-containing protein [Micromonospora narathiwatensis]SBT51245.1 phage shock protein C (PspC) family protein [Micromonospora narathiwatensis]
MTEEAARPPQPGAPSDWPPPPPPTGPPPGASTAGSAPFGPPQPGYAPPPGGFTSRYGLVRPRDGRYLAGVCAAIGRATNTDPVLWRVVLAVLGFFGGIGILVYLTAWLIIPGEGDTASPVESMLGRGRSSMSPVTVIVLSIVVAVGFGYIVTNALRAVLLGAVILIGGALLLNRQPRNAAQRQPAPGPPPGPVPPTGWPAAGPTAPGAGPTWGTAGAATWAGPHPGSPAQPAWPTTPGSAAQPGWTGPPAWPTPGGSAQPAWSTPGTTEAAWAAGPPAQREAGAAPAGEPTAAETAAGQPWPAAESTTVPGGTSGTWGHDTPTWPGTPTTGGTPLGPPGSVPPPSPVGAPLPPGGYRPPFAPRGPYAGAYHPPTPPAPARPPRAPKRPKERSALGAITFSLIFLALGAVAVLDLLGVFPVGAAGYFAAALATIGLGLLVGTWFGRARWLIALGLVAATALGIATVAESYDRVRGIDGRVTWAPPDYQALAVRYKNNFGDAVLDLRAVDFAEKDTEITVEINFGKLSVVVPPKVDVTTVADVNAGDATVFGKRSSGLNGPKWESTDLGPDGRGGGTLRLLIHMNAGDLEVTR